MFASRCIRLCLIVLVLTASASFAGVFISVNFAPPVLPVYAQPVCPGDGYIWTPGYWAYAPAGYYWVPGTWVLAPAPGLLWTPGYWGWGGGVYLWHPGYWGPHVGFYGGVNYGFGYTGVGYAGGMWVGGVFRYNTAVSNVNVSVVHNTYIDRTAIRNTVVNRASFNGPGGIDARPTPGEMAAARDRHMGPTSAQLGHERVSGSNRANFATYNHGAARGAAGRPTTTGYRPNTSQGSGVHAPSYRSNTPAVHNSTPPPPSGHSSGASAQSHAAAQHSSPPAKEHERR